MGGPLWQRDYYERAKQQKVGTEIDAGFFMQYDDDLRAIRDTAFLGKRRREVVA